MPSGWPEAFSSSGDSQNIEFLTIEGFENEHCLKINEIITYF